jgi:hypothetical protein
MHLCSRLGAILLSALFLVFAQAPATAADDPSPYTVLITGANRGIGYELARQYAEQGWTVIATARTPRDATDLKSWRRSAPMSVSKSST